MFFLSHSISLSLSIYLTLSKDDKWSISNLQKHYGTCLFECGKERGSGEPIIRSLNDFIEICRKEELDPELKRQISKNGSSSYLFDPTFDYDCRELGKIYTYMPSESIYYLNIEEFLFV